MNPEGGGAPPGAVGAMPPGRPPGKPPADATAGPAPAITHDDAGGLPTVIALTMSNEPKNNAFQLCEPACTPNLASWSHSGAGGCWSTDGQLSV
jgi:hypothetical protein